MKQIAFAIVVLLNLVGCSSREDQAAKIPVTLDKAQIDIAQMNNIFQGSGGTMSEDWWCYLVNPKPENESERWKRLVGLQNRPITITDGREVLATGQVKSIITSQDKSVALSITFPTPTILDDLENKLGIHRPEMPPALRGTSKPSSNTHTSTRSP